MRFTVESRGISLAEPSRGGQGRDCGLGYGLSRRWQSTASRKSV